MDDDFFKPKTVVTENGTYHITHTMGKLTPKEIRKKFNDALIDGIKRRINGGQVPPKPAS